MQTARSRDVIHMKLVAPLGDVLFASDIGEWGYKFHMNDIAATIGLHQLKFVAETLRRHRENAAYYRAHLGSLRRFKLLAHRADREGAYWLFTARVQDRQRFMEQMS